MDSYSSPSFSSESSSQSPEAVMEQLKAHFAQAYAEEFLEEGFKFRQCGNQPCEIFNWSNSCYTWGKNIAFKSNCFKIKTVRGKCFSKCITKPGTSLSGSESSCISRCVERYMEATGIVGRALFSAQR